MVSGGLAGTLASRMATVARDNAPFQVQVATEGDGGGFRPSVMPDGSVLAIPPDQAGKLDDRGWIHVKGAGLDVVLRVTNVNRPDRTIQTEPANEAALAKAVLPHLVEVPVDGHAAEGSKVSRGERRL